jgi:hypothetical protein
VDGGVGSLVLQVMSTASVRQDADGRKGSSTRVRRPGRVPAQPVRRAVRRPPRAGHERSRSQLIVTRPGQVERRFGRSPPGVIGPCGCAGISGTVARHHSGQGSDS